MGHLEEKVMTQDCLKLQAMLTHRKNWANQTIIRACKVFVISLLISEIKKKGTNPRKKIL